MGQSLRKKVFTFLMISVFTFSTIIPINSIISNLEANNNLTVEDCSSHFNGYDASNWNPQESSLIKYDYTPISDLVYGGNNFTIEDSFKVNDAFSLELNNANSLVNNFTINENISDVYSPNSLYYNITSIQATINETIYMDVTDKEDEVISNSVSDFIASAQQFEVSTTYATFQGAFMSISITNPGNIGSNQLELFVVKEAGGIPDLSDVRTYAVNSPYNSSNYSDFNGLFHFYDFNDITLEQGFYYVVANLSFIDPLPASDVVFAWQGAVGYHAGDTFSRTHAGVWEASGASGNYDFSLGVKLIASDEFGNPIQYSDPSSVLLQDNGLPITTLEQSIISAGVHNISANATIIVSFNNSYEYSTNYDALSSVSVSNSTFGDYSNIWTLTWSTNSYFFTIF